MSKTTGIGLILKMKVYRLQGQVIIVYELDSSSPWQNTAQYENLPAENWGLGRPVSKGESRAAATGACLTNAQLTAGLLVAEEYPISGLRLRAMLHNMT
jgi:hypothetical protein